MNIVNAIFSFIEKHKLLPPDSTIILGLSGGPDSIFLLNILAPLHAQKKISLIAAHLDHGWRADSANDALFCAQAAEALQIPFVSEQLKNLPGNFHGSKEEQGRAARRAFFKQVQEQYNAHVIALAHHLQDQQETFFIRLIRGTSLTGLTAMKAKQGVYVRPLLEINKKDIVEYLDSHAIAYLVDPSNTSFDFLRNRIRHTVLPALVACDERFDKNFLVTIERLQETEDFLQAYTHEILQTITHKEDNITKIDIPALLQLHPAVRDRVLLTWLWNEKVSFAATQQFIQEVLRFFQGAESKTHTIHHGWKIVKKKKFGWISHQ